MKAIAKLAATCAIFAALGFHSPAKAEVFRLNIGAGHQLAALWIGQVKEFFMPRVVERVRAETKHEIQWVEGFGGTVCKLGECLAAIESGLLDIGDASPPFEPSKLRPFNFSYFAPFPSADPRMVTQAVKQVVDETPELMKLLERYNQVYLAFGPVANYGMVSTFPWSGVKDLNGKKFGAAGPNLAWIEGTGIVPVQSSANAAYMNMQTGVMDGRIMVPDAVVSFKLHEVSKQWMNVDFGAAGASMLTMNSNTWKRLPEDVRKIIKEVAQEWATRLAEKTYVEQTAAQDEMKRRGMMVTTLSDDEKAAWAKRLSNLPKIRGAEIAKQGVPDDVVYRYIAALEKRGHVFPRDWKAER